MRRDQYSLYPTESHALDGPAQEHALIQAALFVSSSEEALAAHDDAHRERVALQAMAPVPCHIPDLYGKATEALCVVQGLYRTNWLIYMGFFATDALTARLERLEAERR